jgi:hypothetical protein
MTLNRTPAYRPTSGAGALCRWQTERATSWTRSHAPLSSVVLNLARSDTGQARRAASFILAWWNAESLGAFDIADLFSLDAAIANDMAIVFAWIALRSNAVYPEEYRLEIEALIEAWQPEVRARCRERVVADSPATS